MKRHSEQAPLRLTVVGHVDHGKSTLIGRLLHDTNSLPEETLEEIRERSRDLGKEIEFSYVMDHLVEEREKGITIDTAQIWLHTEQRSYVIIDAPGHKEFLKNMLTGASQAEAALLLVDANEGAREQTLRHAYLLSLLGLEQVAVLINKMDLVDYSEEHFKSNAAAIQRFFEKIGIAPRHIIPLSARLGDNVVTPSDRIPWYSGPTVVEALESFVPEARQSYPFRYPIQDVYTVDGQKVFAGRLESGTLASGDRALLLPNEDEVTIHKIMKFEGEVQQGEAGECLGLILDDGVEARRGQVLCHPRSPCRPVRRTRATLIWLSSRPLEMGGTYTFKLGTQEGACRVGNIIRRMDSSSLVEKEERSTLQETETAEVLLDFDDPVLAETFTDLKEMGRFVFEEARDVVAAGIITQTLD